MVASGATTLRLRLNICKTNVQARQRRALRPEGNESAIAQAAIALDFEAGRVSMRRAAHCLA